MKKKLLSILLALTLIFQLAPAALAAGEAEIDPYEYLTEIAEFIRQYGYYSDESDDPIMRAVQAYLETDPGALETLLYYMLNSYDGRSGYIPSYLFDPDALQTSGYVGVGVTLSMYEDGNVEIVGLNEMGSAFRAGIKMGDFLVSVDGKSVREMSLEDIGLLLRGEENTYVKVEVKRGSRVLPFTLQRTFLGEHEFSHRRLEEGVWYMKWLSFNEIDSMDGFYAAIEEMKAANAGALVLDLRGNLGGRVDMAKEVVNALIPKESLHYLTMIGRNGNIEITEKLVTDGTGIQLDKIVVLCDGNTASSSEIIMSAICENGFGESVGTKTYGKATAQYQIETAPGGLMVLTAYKIARPDGSDYDQEGLSPDYEVKNTVGTAPAFKTRLREVGLVFGNCSDDSERLNAALLALGYMKEAEKAYRFGEDTQAAVDNFRAGNGLEPAPGIDVATIALINLALDQLGATSITHDLQLVRALEIAQSALGSR